MYLLTFFLILTTFYCQADYAPNILRVVEKKIVLNGKEAVILSVEQPDGTLGLTGEKGQLFNVRLENTLSIPTSIHWHGLILPNDQDGVAFITQYPLYPGQSYVYQFPLLQAGTFWMHSHLGLQEQRLLTAPLILHDPEEANLADQEVIMLLNDFSFKSPEEIYEDLKCNCKIRMSTSTEMRGPDIVDVNYDAFLANHHTLESPEIVPVEPGKKIRLRIINGSSATNFFIALAPLQADIIAVDGSRTQPLAGSLFELGVAQRIDLLFTIPEQGGAFPILAQGEGTDMQTGIILATKNSTIPVLSSKTLEKAGRLTNAQEFKLSALHPLSPKNPQQKTILTLNGDMAKYIWTLDGKAWPETNPLVVEKGQRIEITLKNETTMIHPMHLHGHVFQVTAINDKPINGALRDTVLVPPHSTLSIQFDADNPGVWPFHCHVLYHLEAGMLTVLRYKDFIQPLKVGMCPSQ